MWTATTYCLRPETGSLLWKKAISDDVHLPVPADIDDDVCIEIVVGTHPDFSGYSFFALDDPGNNADRGQVLDIGREQASGSYGLEFRPMGCGLYLFLPSEAWISIELYDASGRLVKLLYDGVFSVGGHTFSPNTEMWDVCIAFYLTNPCHILQLSWSGAWVI